MSALSSGGAAAAPLRRVMAISGFWSPGYARGAFASVWIKALRDGQLIRLQRPSPIRDHEPVLGRAESRSDSSAHLPLLRFRGDEQCPKHRRVAMRLNSVVVRPAAANLVFRRSAKFGGNGGADTGGISTRREADRCLVNERFDSHRQPPGSGGQHRCHGRSRAIRTRRQRGGNSRAWGRDFRQKVGTV
jgi:hypothetical protein